ncbi:MAG: hypothetical protein HC769_25570 [Cyanobacteria bacterium CRU_2_1]|nr:hypothetical protein [Cyanobacteria bacterium CRU_2_1]
MLSGFSAFSPPVIELAIRQVEATGRPGVYAVAGNTTLPDQTRLTVSAVRYLQYSQQAALTAIAEPDYSILDRQFAEVREGNWQANLNLWQIASDGNYQEAWQLDQRNTAIRFNPQPTVTFMATLDPASQPGNFRAQVERQDESTQIALTRFTTDGELYLETSQVLTVSLPSGNTSPPSTTLSSSPRRSSSSQVNVSQSPEGDSGKTWSQTNTPLTPDQLFR